MTPLTRTLVRGGLVVSTAGERRADVLVVGETITQVGIDLEGFAQVDRTIREILLGCARRVMPDVLSCVPEAKAMLRWSKRAKELRDSDQNLLVWRDDSGPK